MIAGLSFQVNFFYVANHSYRFILKKTVFYMPHRNCGVFSRIVFNNLTLYAVFSRNLHIFLAKYSRSFVSLKAKIVGLNYIFKHFVILLNVDTNVFHG